MAPTDLKKQFKHLYEPRRGEFAIVEVPPMHFLMVDGEGDPNTAPAFSEGIKALYGTAFTMKFLLKKIDLALDFVVPPLEGLWWADDPSAFHESRRAEWKWTLMIAQPDSVTEDLVRQALRQMADKKKLPLQPPRFELYSEGLAIQTMHVGPYVDEGPVIEKMHVSLREMGHVPRGKHHEIYLNNPQRTKPEKLKTVLRQPVA